MNFIELETLLLDAKKGHEIIAFFKIIKEYHKLVSGGLEERDAYDTLVSFTEDNNIQSPADFHRIIKEEADRLYLKRKDSKTPGSQNSDWFVAVNNRASEATKYYSPKKNLFNLHTDVLPDSK